MYFLVNEEKKIIFGYSPKCGCTKIKMYFNFYSGKNNYDNINPDMTYNFKIPHTYDTYGGLPNNHNEYTIVLFIRNPYKRLLSGFIDRYCISRCRLNIREFNFQNFVNELDANGVNRINSQHFSPQLSQKYEDNIKFTKIFDIENIDYEYLDQLFGKKLDDGLIKLRTSHQLKYSETYDDTNKKAYHLNKFEIRRMHEKPKLKYFLNDDIISKINKYYKKDFDFFKENGFDYYIVNQQ